MRYAILRIITTDSATTSAATRPDNITAVIACTNKIISN